MSSDTALLMCFTFNFVNQGIWDGLADNSLSEGGKGEAEFSGRVLSPKCPLKGREFRTISVPAGECQRDA